MSLHALILALAFAQATQEAPATAHTKAHTWRDFPVLVWREEFAGNPLPPELAAPFGGTILMRGEDSGWAREQALSYLVWNVAGRDALHLDADELWSKRVEKWMATRDEELLVRRPCLSDPEVIAKLFGTLEATLARHGENAGLGFVLGDEVSLTPNGDPFDLCRSEHCEAAWRVHAKEHGLPARAPLTDEVRLALGEDDYSGFGAWLARRRFDQERLLTLLESLARTARGRDERRVALLGLKGRTAFGALDVFGAGRFADILEGYAVGDTRPSLMTTSELPELYRFAMAKFPGHDANLTTLFLEGESDLGAAWLAWEAWMRGADGLVLWSDRALLHDARLRARLADTLGTLRSVRARFKHMSTPLLSGIALVHDGDSIAAAWMADAMLDGPTWPRRTQATSEAGGRRERKVRAWLQLADDCGITLGCTTLQGVGRHFSVLILPSLLVLDAQDLERLAQYLDAGGTLVVDGRLGWVNRAGMPWAEDVLESLRKRAPERVLPAPTGIEDYPTLRALPPAGAGMRAFLQRLGQPSAVAIRTEGEAQPRWLRTRRSAGIPGPVRASLFAFLPSATTPEERASLQPLSLEVSCEREFEWIHPREGELLPPGDAAVLLVR